MIDNIRVVAWLFFCLLFELLVIAVVSPLHGADREPVCKSAIFVRAGELRPANQPCRANHQLVTRLRYHAAGGRGRSVYLFVQRSTDFFSR